VDFDIPEELQLLARTTRDFVETRLQPLEKQVEETDKIPSDVLKEMGQLGFFGLPFPEEYGGVGAGDLGYCLALEQFGRTSAEKRSPRSRSPNHRADLTRPRSRPARRYAMAAGS